MKRKFLALMIFTIFLCCLFVNINPQNDITHAIVDESDVIFIQDIVSINKSEMEYNMQFDASFGKTPFDTSTGSVMPGYSVTPRTSAQNHYQITNESYTVNEFSIKNSESIYMWIYLPDAPLENLYTLTLKFINLDSGNSISWTFTPFDLDSLINDVAAYSYGWKLLELSLNDAKLSGTIDSTTTFIIFEINYEIILNDIMDYLSSSNLGVVNENLYVANGDLSFYHIYLGKSSSTSSRFVLNLSYYNYSLKSDFLDEISLLILNDTYVVRQKSDMFNYLYVGKTNLMSTSLNSNYNLEYTFQFGNDIKERRSSEKITFSEIGEYTFSITLKEKKCTRALLTLQAQQETKIIFSSKQSFYIKDYVFGQFNRSVFQLNPNKKYIIYFDVKRDFQIQGELTFNSSNDRVFKVESVDFDEDSGRYAITVVAEKAGRANLEASAVGTRSDESKQKNVYASTNIEVPIVKEGYSELFSFLLILTIICAVSFLIFGFFTLRTIKKNKRLQKRQ